MKETKEKSYGSMLRRMYFIEFCIAIIPVVVVGIIVLLALNSNPMNNQNSKCCGSSVTAISSDEGTSYYQCNRCLQPTDVVTTSKSEEKCDVVSKLTEEDARKIANEFDPFTRLEKSEKTVKCDDCGKMLRASGEVGVEGHFCTRLENWEKKITDILGLEKVDEEWCLITRDEDDNMVEYVEWSGEVKELKVLISTLLQEEREPEIVICAAVRTPDGKIIRCHRHHHGLLTLRDIGEKTKFNSHDDQGFVTSRNRYVTRKEGLEIQKKAGIPSADKDGYKSELYSEDLF